MAPISSAGSFAIPATQPSRKQAEPTVTATDNEKSVQQTLRVNDDQGRKPSEQVKATSVNTPAEQQVSNEEQQKIEGAQQEAQRAEFNQQAGNVRNAEPNEVRPSSQTIQLPQSAAAASESTKNETTQNESIENNRVQRETDSANKPAIDIFNQFQNINAAPRQGQELNQFV